MAKSLQNFYCDSFSIGTHPTFYKSRKIPIRMCKISNSCKIRSQLDLREAFSSFNDRNSAQFPVDASYGSLLDVCASKRYLAQGQQIHAHIITSNSNLDDVFLGTKLIFMYGKCASLIDAKQLFDRMPHRTIFTWNAVIGAYSSNAKPREALFLYKEMRECGISIDSCTFPSVLKACGELKELKIGSEMHALSVKTGFISFVFVANALLSMYSKCGDVNSSKKLFDKIINRGDTVSWNSMIFAFSQNRQFFEALKTFTEMQKTGISVNAYTIVGVLQACGELSSIKLGMELHGYLLKSSERTSLYEANALIVMYAKCNQMAYAIQIFNEMDEVDGISWNSILSGFVQNGFYDEALNFFSRMQETEFRPDEVSVINIASALGHLGNLINGRVIHAYAIKNGLDSSNQVGNTLMDMYAKCGGPISLIYMERIFHIMSEKDIISWTTIISGFSQNQHYFKATEYFQASQKKGLRADPMMIGSLLLTCSDSKCILHAKQIHAFIVRNGLFDLVLENALVDVYGECREIIYSSRVFDRIRNKNVISWTSMVSCYVRNEFMNEAVTLFREMVFRGIEPDFIAIISVLSAISSLSSLIKGKETHGYLTRRQFKIEGSVAAALVDMYANCGTFDNSLKVFDSVKFKDIVLWTSMIDSCGMHGRGKEALNLFKRMQKSNLIPDHITFLALLHACSHSGMVKEGMIFFEMMKDKYLLDPWTEHYACVVDLLGRSNHLNEAYHFIEQMPIKPTSAIWCALLSSCHVHSNRELGEIASRNLLELEPQNPGNYVLVSNIFAANRRWQGVEEVRMRMKSRGLRKIPACSWIEVGGKVHSFIASDNSHPQITEIYSKVDLITEVLENECGYVADTRFVLRDVTEKNKRKMLNGHSERLAIAFGLLSLPGKLPIRVTKNLRICGDCHVFCKFVSKVFNREIIIRDASRFHHFHEGICSCGDFW